MRKREAYEIEAKIGNALNLINKNEGAMSGVGRVMARAIFGFNSDIGRIAPDAWYLPEDRHKPAIISTCVSPDIDITKRDCYSENILKTCLQMFNSPSNYDKITGILYNGDVCRIFTAEDGVITEVESERGLPLKEDRNYYLNIWQNKKS